MAYDIKDFTGSLFRSKDKMNANHADSSGKVKIAGVEYWINGWTKTTKAGEKYVSLTFKPVNQKASKPKPDERFLEEAGKFGDPDAPLPF